MDLLNELVIPPSENHIMLVKYMLVISLLLFIPYISMLLGASFISTWFNKRGKQNNNPVYLRFAKDVIEKLTISRSAELALGAIPAASALFAYAQLLYASESITIGIMALSVLLFMISFVFIYRYRSSFQVINLLDTVKGVVNPSNTAANAEINRLERSILSSNAIAFSFGKWLLFIAAYLFIGTKALAGNPARWAEVGNILQVIFSWQTIFDFIQFLSISGIVSGSAIMFYFFYWPAYSKDSAGGQGGLKIMDDDYKKFVKNFAGSLTLVSAFIFPLTIAISYMYLPVTAQTQSVFLIMLLILILALVTSIYIYTVIKTSDTSPAAAVFGLIIVLLLLNIVKDQQALAGAIEPQLAETVRASDKMEEEIKAKLISSSGIDAQQIYNTKCFACHKFDVKLVGPPYQETVPKYNGDIKALSEFIFNPVKKNPAYPPMPNQGLRKKEAEAMAKWLIEKVSGKTP